MDSAQADFMVANSSKSLYGGMEPHLILHKSGEILRTNGKQQTAITLIEQFLQ